MLHDMQRYIERRIYAKNHYDTQQSKKYSSHTGNSNQSPFGSFVSSYQNNKSSTFNFMLNF